MSDTRSWTAEPFDSAPANKAWGRYQRGKPLQASKGSDESIEQAAFAAGWDAHIELKFDEHDLREEARSGCAPLLLLTGGLALVLSLTAAILALWWGTDARWWAIVLFMAVGIALLAIGRWRLIVEGKRYVADQRDFHDKWRKP